MALNPVSLDERFRPWLSAGITHFLLPEGCFLEPGQPAPPQPEKQSPPASRPAVPPSRRYADSRPPSPAPPKPAQTAKAPQPVSIGRPAPVSPEKWPDRWRQRLMNTPKAPVIWTYPELGDDLSGNGDKARSTCLRELIGAAGLPKGSSAFWPLILQEGNEADAGTAIPEARKADSLYFQQGLRLLSPRALIMFGARSISLSGLELSIHSPFTQVIRQGILYMILPEFKALLTDREAFSRTSTYLRASLTPIPGIFK